MKKSIVLFAASLFVLVTVQAQFSVGVRAGLNISKEDYANTKVYSTSSHAFYTAGIFSGYIFKKQFGIETGLYYSAEGTEESYKSSNSTVTGVVTIKRMNVPLLLQYHTGRGIYFETGPQAGFLLAAGGNYTTGKYDFKKYTQSALISWCAGAGYQFATVLPGVGINVTYAKGLSRIDKGTVNAGKITGNTFSMRLSYRLSVKGKK